MGDSPQLCHPPVRSCLVDLGQTVGGLCDDASVTIWTLSDVAAALRSSWAADTCSPDDVARSGWRPDNPALGHCDLTALIVNDVFGGDLMVAEVHLDGEQRGYHWWNRLDNGYEIDLTRQQFRHGEVLDAVRRVQRPPGKTRRRWEEYLLLRDRVGARLGELPPPAGGVGGG